MQLLVCEACKQFSGQSLHDLGFSLPTAAPVLPIHIAGAARARCWYAEQSEADTAEAVNEQLQKMMDAKEQLGRLNVLLGPGIFYTLLFSLLPFVFVQPSLLLIPCRDTAEEQREFRKLCMLLVAQQPLYFEFQCLAAEHSMCTARNTQPHCKLREISTEKQVQCILYFIYFILFYLLFYFICFSLFVSNILLVSYVAEHEKRKWIKCKIIMVAPYPLTI